VNAFDTPKSLASGFGRGQLDHSILDGCLSFNLTGKNVIGDWDVYGKIR
jgi:hypothetical protein